MYYDVIGCCMTPVSCTPHTFKKILATAGCCYGLVVCEQHHHNKVAGQCHKSLANNAQCYYRQPSVKDIPTMTVALTSNIGKEGVGWCVTLSIVKIRLALIVESQKSHTSLLILLVFLKPHFHHRQAGFTPK